MKEQFRMDLLTTDEQQWRFIFDCEVLKLWTGRSFFKNRGAPNKSNGAQRQHSLFDVCVQVEGLPSGLSVLEAQLFAGDTGVVAGPAEVTDGAGEAVQDDLQVPRVGWSHEAQRGL